MYKRGAQRHFIYINSGTVCLLLEHDPNAAEEILTEVTPFFERLKFYPEPGAAQKRWERLYEAFKKFEFTSALRLYVNRSSSNSKRCICPP